MTEQTWIPKTVKDALKDIPETEKELVLSYIQDLTKQIKTQKEIPVRELPLKGTEFSGELRKNGKVMALVNVSKPKVKMVHFPPKNPQKKTLLVLKNHFARLELFYYKMSQEKLFLSINGEWFQFENGNEGKLSSKILNYDKNISSLHKRRRKRYRKN